MLTELRNFYAYNEWATEAMFKALEQLSMEEYNAPGCSGNGSTRDTLAHLLGTEWGWFAWFNGSKSVGESMQMKITGEEIDTLQKARERWSEVNKQTQDCLKKLTEADVQKEWVANMPNGATMKMQLGEMIFHVANHGTHTRGQIIAAIRRAGHNPGTVEYFRFALQNGMGSMTQ